MKNLVVHLVSESSGQTVKHAANNALAKFSDIDIKKYHWPMTRNEKLLDELLGKIKRKPGVIIYTISNDKLRNKLKQFASENKLPCVSVVKEIIKKISEYVGVGVDNFLGYSDKFDQSYFEKVEAIEYSMKHDDGQSLEELENAEIILIGPSRTSKTPTSIYLAYNGFKTANVPYVDGIGFPEELLHLKHPIIFGLTINPSRLIEIRQSRMNLLSINDTSNYTDFDVINRECREVKKFCIENGWNSIDVSRKSIEETAALIMKYYYEKKARR